MGKQRMSDRDVDEFCEAYHYGIFVPIETLAFALGWLFYPLVEWLVSHLERIFYAAHQG